MKISPQSCENLQTFVWWGERTCLVKSWKKRKNCGRVYPLYYWSKYFHEICSLIDCEVTTITSTNLVPRGRFFTSKAREKRPGDEVAHQRQRERQKSNITLKSKSTTFHGNHALLYISSPSGFPFRKWSLVFFRHFFISRNTECFC